MILDSLAGMNFLVEFNAKSCWAIVRAYFFIILNFIKIGKAKKKYAKLVKEHSIGKSNLTGRYNGSILLQYYLLKHKKAHQFYPLKKKES